MKKQTNTEYKHQNLDQVHDLNVTQASDPLKIRNITADKTFRMTLPQSLIYNCQKFYVLYALLRKSTH